MEGWWHLQASFTRAPEMSPAQYTLKITTTLLAMAALAGCAGNGQGLDANGSAAGSGDGGGPLTADFQSIQDNIFTPICTKCHLGAGAPEGMQLDATHSYAAIVGVPSAEQPNLKRVDPGDPDSSYIIHKLEGGPAITGERMPFGGPYLSQAMIDVVRQWVTNGAQKSPTSVSLEASIRAVQHFGVASTAPDNDAIVSATPAQIIVAFNGDIDSTLLNETTVTVTRVDGRQAAVPVVISLPAGNPSAVLIKPRTALTNGTYSVMLQGSLANMSAQSLGNNYSFTFTVDVLP